MSGAPRCVRPVPHYVGLTPPFRGYSLGLQLLVIAAELSETESPGSRRCFWPESHLADSSSTRGQGHRLPEMGKSGAGLSQAPAARREEESSVRSSFSYTVTC